ncbi:MAG TPA: hypothetical protein PKA05_13715, partial [Roseiflexaceae bacterium]|nr:hypothetical protein [Roseiflexaceae bacterium]
APEPTPAAADLPAWLQQPTETAPEPTPAAADLPAWLQQPAETAPEPTPAAEPLPDWLNERASIPASPAAAADDLPPWLTDESGRPLPSAGEAGLPEWLQGATIESSPTPQARLDSAPPAVPPDKPAVAAGSSADGGFLKDSDIPAWLQAEPTQPAQPAAEATQSLDWGWLRKIGGYEEETGSTSAMPAAVRLEPPQPPLRSAAQIEAITLLQKLAAAPFPAARPHIEPAAPTIWQRIGLERVLYLGLLLVVIIGVGLPGATAGLAGPIAAPGAAAFQQQIATLGEEDIVLLAYEWDVRRVGELRPLEQAVLQQLIEQRVRMVLVSTDPQGALLQFDARDLLTAAAYQPGGQDYVLLGYRPGGEMALRVMAQDFRAVLRSDFQGDDATIGALATNLATGEPRLAGLRDFSQIIVLADDMVDVQGWMEQIYPYLSDQERIVPLAFVLPAEIAPLAQPYTRQFGVLAIAGHADALAYNVARGASPAASASDALAQQRFILLALVILLTIGALIAGIDAARRRRRS